MENSIEKSPEQLKTENENLMAQLTEATDKLKELGALLVTAKERNVKLVYSTRLFAELHLTRDEKLAIAQEFDRAINLEQVEKVYYKYYNQVVPPGVDLEKDFLWSQGFTRDMEKYYFQYKGYNPFENISNAIKTIRLRFNIEEDLRITDDPERIKLLRENWNANRDASLAAVDEILSITNEILKK